MADDARLAIVLEANIDKLNAKLDAANAKVASSMKRVSHDIEEADGAWSKLFGKADPGEALEKVFSRSRLATLEEGSAKIPIFGSALESLGTAGLVGAAGVAAVAGALEQAAEAAEFAEKIKDLADKLGITTTALQEYQFAAVASGVSTEAVNTALEQGNKVLGEFQSNIAGGKVKKVFDALGITPEEARKAQNITELLPEIAEKIKDLAPAEQAGIADRLGLAGILPILQKGKEGIDELRQAAESSGAVLDTELIQKGAEAAEKLKEAGAEVDGNLKRAFIGLAPYIAACLELVAKIAKGIADAVESFGPISSFSRVHVNDAIADSRGVQNAIRPFVGKIDPKTGVATGEGSLFGAADIYNNHERLIRQQYQPRLAELDKLDAAVKPKAGSTRQLVADKPEHEKKGPADQSVELDKAAQTAIDDAQKEYAAAVKAASDAAAKLVYAWNAADRQVQQDAQADRDAAFERAEIDADLNKKLNALKEEEARIQASKNDKHRAEQLAILESARARDIDTANIKKQTADTNAAVKKEQNAREAQLAILEEQSRAIADQASTQTAQDQAASALARTSSDRLFYAQKLLTDAFSQESQRITEYYDRLRVPVNLQPDGPQKIKDLAELQSQEDGQRANLRTRTTAQRAVINHQNLDPLQAFVDSAPKDSKEVQEALEAYAVKGIEDFNSGVAEAISQGKSLGDVLKKAFQDAEAALISYLLKQAEVGLIGNLFSSFTGGPAGGAGGLQPSDLIKNLPKFADGGFVGGSGGPRSDDILARLSPGEFVLSNDMQRQLSRTVPPAGASASISIPYAPVYYITGSGPELDRLRAEMAADRASFSARASAAVQDGLQRGVIRPGRR